MNFLFIFFKKTKIQTNIHLLTKEKIQNNFFNTLPCIYLSNKS